MVLFFRISRALLLCICATFKSTDHGHLFTDSSRSFILTLVRQLLSLHNLTRIATKQASIHLVVVQTCYLSQSMIIPANQIPLRTLVMLQKYITNLLLRQTIPMAIPPVNLRLKLLRLNGCLHQFSIFIFWRATDALWQLQGSMLFLNQLIILAVIARTFSL